MSAKKAKNSKQTTKPSKQQAQQDDLKKFLEEQAKEAKLKEDAGQCMFVKQENKTHTTRFIQSWRKV